MPSVNSNPGFLQVAGDLFLKAADGLWKEGAKAVEQVRGEIHNSWFGRYPQQEQQQPDGESVYGPAEQDKGDPMGRTQEKEVWSDDDFRGFNQAYERHQGLGATQELDNAWDWQREDGQIPDAFDAARGREAQRDEPRQRSDEMER